MEAGLAFLCRYNKLGDIPGFTLAFGAMSFAVILLLQLRKIEQDLVHKLVWMTNPYEKLRIRLFTVYWQFMDAVWLILFLLFVLSF